MKRFIKIIVIIIAISGIGWVAMVAMTSIATTYTLSMDESERFSFDEVEAAAEVVRKEFRRGFDGHKPYDINYDEAWSDHQLAHSSLDRNNALVLQVKNGGWTCTIVRDGKGSQWRVMDHGYA